MNDGSEDTDQVHCDVSDDMVIREPDTTIIESVHFSVKHLQIRIISQMLQNFLFEDRYSSFSALSVFFLFQHIDGSLRRIHG